MVEMKKRLRKKKHKGEFRQWGSQFDISLKEALGFDPFLDRFIAKVEELGCFCGGGGKETTLSLVVELGCGVVVAGEKRGVLEHWTLGQPEVQGCSSTQLFDLWYGPYPEDLDLK